ncbi:unnamed protein product [Schistosoma turkestanicum]|nr:unnamed protein product [Schistosoma turkestanicum]
MFAKWIYFALIYLIHITVSMANRRLHEYHNSELIDIDLPSGVSKPYYTFESNSHENHKVLSHIRRRARKRTRHLFITPLDLLLNLRRYDNDENDYVSESPVYFRQFVDKARQALSVSPEKHQYLSEEEEFIKILIRLIRLFSRRRFQKVRPVVSVNHILLSQPNIHPTNSEEHPPPNNLIDFCKNQQPVPSTQSALNSFPVSKTVSLPYTNPTESSQQTSQSYSSDPSIQTGTISNVDVSHSKTKAILSKSSQKYLVSPPLQSMLSGNYNVQTETDPAIIAQQSGSNFPSMPGFSQLASSTDLTLEQQGYKYRPVPNNVEAISSIPIGRSNILTAASITDLPQPKEINQQSSLNTFPATYSLALTSNINNRDNFDNQPTQHGQPISSQRPESLSHTDKFAQQSLTQQPSQISPVTSNQKNVPPTGQDLTHTSQSPNVNNLAVKAQTQSLGQQKQNVILHQPSHKPVQKASKTYADGPSPLPPEQYSVSKIGNYDWDYNIVHSSSTQRRDLKNYAVKQKILEQIRRVLSYS